MDAHLIGIDLAKFLPMQIASVAKQPPAQPAKDFPQMTMTKKESSTRPTERYV